MQVCVITQIEEKQNESTIRDYISLLKPRVMSLVVFTALISIFLAPDEIHPLVASIAVFCVALGSGAAGAINMWYERETDALMVRTKNRAIPAGRINPENAIEFAVFLAFASVFIMAIGVNYVAAFLLTIAILFYVFIYTIWLKRRTPQNIVIGGAAGAFPPLIGWAAVTGNFAIEGIILFLIIFVWTPPHFWALALYKNDDYTNAGIPMLPVVRGQVYTLKQMVIYSIILFMVSLLPFIIGMSGLVYFTGAFLLGAYFVFLILKLQKNYTEELSRKIFIFSIRYLFLIFILLYIDKVIGYAS